ncbi:MAG: uracil phosphoribosyltransferase, partial [Alphaproteobacteria bacterium]
MPSEVIQIRHPLVQHKLTVMRDKSTATLEFRRLMREIGMLLAYEVTRDLEVAEVEIDTPLETMSAPMLEGKKLCLAPILRAGLGLAEGMLDLIPSARVAHIGLYR